MTTKKNKKRDCVEDSDLRERVNVVFIGHVDAGKSTIGGHLMYLTGMVDERTIQKYEKEAAANNRGSWYIAYVMDTNEEERAKGKTVEVARARFETEKKRYVVLDAPGHKTFVPNMITGTAQADVAILVISARKGEFEAGYEKGGQTREHAMLAKTLGVQQLIVVINKMDSTEPEWDQKRYAQIEKKLTLFLRQCGFKEDTLHFLPISGYTGENIVDPMADGKLPWFQGTSLVNTLDNLPPLERQVDGPVRIPVMDRYKDMGTIVMGKMESGRIALDDVVTMMPNNKECKVAGIQIDEVDYETAKAGDNLCVKLSGIEEDEISTGFVLCTPDNLVKTMVEFDAQLAILELMEHKPLFTAGYTAVMHIHTVAEEISVTTLFSQFDRKVGKWPKKAPPFVKSGAQVRVRMQMLSSEPICAETFKDVAQLGRFSLRDEGKTIAFGKILRIIK